MGSKHKHSLCEYKQIINTLYDNLQSVDIVAEISARVKDPYSILKKMDRKHIKVEQLRDIVAFRIIVNNKDDCYRALDTIQEFYEIIPEKNKDFIAQPKNNGYQSLHTTIIVGTSKRNIEIQIRTRKMHDIAEQGEAAHWKYKQDKEQEIYRLIIDNQWLQEIYKDLDQCNWTEPELTDYEQKIKNIYNQFFIIRQEHVKVAGEEI